MRKKVEETLARLGVRPGEKILVGVSGGADSVCLCDLLRRIDFPLHVAHLNHCFRGKEAEEEASFVGEIADRWEIPTTIEKEDVPSLCKRGLSAQATAREVRYRFFHRVAHAVGARWIALGHTADDQAETFLMRVLRGSGPRGLAGIPLSREGRIIRPLLTIRKEEIIQHLRTEEIPWRSDSSNLKPLYLRNKIRLALLPLLHEGYNPRIVETLNREASILREEDAFLEEHIQGLLPTMILEKEEGVLSFDRVRLSGLPPVLQRRVLRWGIEAVQGGLHGVTFQHIEKIRQMLSNRGKGREVHLPHGVRVETAYEKVIVRGTEEGGKDIGTTYLPLPGEVELPALKIKISATLLSSLPVRLESGEAAFDLTRLSLPLMIRGWREGDFFYPRGVGGKKKIQDFFVDEKIPRSKRREIPFLVSSQGVLWIIGYRLDARFLADVHTEGVLLIRVYQQ